MKKLLLAALLGCPSLLAAQTNTTVSTFVASDGAVSGTPVMVGATLGWEIGPVGLRWSVAADSRSAFASGIAPAEGPEGVLNADLDGVVFIGSPTGKTTVPYAVVGLGVRALQEDSTAAAAAVWSYGGGLRVALAERLALEGELRYRQPVLRDPAVVPADLKPGLEFRAGLTMRVGRRPALPLPAPPVSRPAPLPVPAEPAAAARFRMARQVLDTADGYLGVTYKWGGNTPDGGFDCSGFIRYVFRQHGIELPRVSRDQARFGVPLPLDISALEPGDLLAFASRGEEVDHTAIYVGEGRIIHSSSSGGGVRYDDLTTQRGEWYVRHLVAARRVIDSHRLATGR